MIVGTDEGKYTLDVIVSNILEKPKHITVTDDSAPDLLVTNVDILYFVLQQYGVNSEVIKLLKEQIMFVDDAYIASLYTYIENYSSYEITTLHDIKLCPKRVLVTGMKPTFAKVNYDMSDATLFEYIELLTMLNVTPVTVLPTDTSTPMNLVEFNTVEKLDNVLKEFTIYPELDIPDLLDFVLTNPDLIAYKATFVKKEIINNALKIYGIVPYDLSDLEKMVTVIACMFVIGKDFANKLSHHTDVLSFIDTQFGLNLKNILKGPDGSDL